MILFTSWAYNADLKRRQTVLKQRAVDKSDILIFGVIKEFHLFVNSDSVAPKCIHLETVTCMKKKKKKKKDLQCKA